MRYKEIKDYDKRSDNWEDHAYSGEVYNSAGFGKSVPAYLHAVDSIIVGHFIGKEALAAVGICNPVTTLVILFLNGLCMGASILIGTYYGAKDYDTLSRQISTTMIQDLYFL